MDSRIAKVEEAQKDLLNRMHNEYEELVNNIEKIMRKSQLKFVENLQSMDAAENESTSKIVTLCEKVTQIKEVVNQISNVAMLCDESVDSTPKSSLQKRLANDL